MKNQMGRDSDDWFIQARASNDFQFTWDGVKMFGRFFVRKSIKRAEEEDREGHEGA